MVYRAPTVQVLSSQFVLSPCSLLSPLLGSSQVEVCPVRLRAALQCSRLRYSA